MLARVHSSTLWGVDAVLVHIEVQLLSALRRFSIVGLPDGVVREAKERVRCAIENSGFPFPNGEVIVNLAPADLPKAGSAFDLAIASGILVALGLLPHSAIDRRLLLGELALDGTVKPARGALAAACLARELEFGVVASPHSAREARLVNEVPVTAITSLAGLVSGRFEAEAAGEPEAPEVGEGSSLSYGDVAGQFEAKRAMEIAAAGWHNVLMIGPPGSGKSMMARRLESILPAPSAEEQIEVIKIRSADHSVELESRHPVQNVRPFRSPHHTLSTAGLVGGGSHPGPGEVSLAHHGVLFLDELPHIKRDALEALREPLETQQVVISRAKQRVSFPANFLLIAAMNPCPCGKRGGTSGTCTCAPGQVQKYMERISGPILDRIDLQTWVPPVALSEFVRLEPGCTETDPTALMAERVRIARQAQVERGAGRLVANSRLSPAQVRRVCKLSTDSVELLESASKRQQLSARGYTRVLKVARTIADLERRAEISDEHVSEALSFRMSAL